ncbi:TadE/TadG family type IV pilus assembly protein [Novosphingobium sp. TH158]|uniref:TadE/TadG family type IV pilus assembly protein n=1 Tax=Novosphingobium sp. TH158 TaxID=2067455 RepID=UPI0020B1692C|nr:TadE family protein [Novosphingobium sp. TH158]
MTRRLLHDRQGAAAVEFALIAPALLMLVLGTFELGLAQYLRAVLEGAMQQAGRNSTLQKSASSQTGIDDYVRTQVRAVMPGANVTFSRRNYSTFSDVLTPEDFTDLNANGRYDSGECFIDENDNRTWDSDVAKSGQGGANDVVLYTATVSYSSTLPMSALGLSPVRELTASTTLRNQPYSSQASRSAVQICG